MNDFLLKRMRAFSPQLDMPELNFQHHEKLLPKQIEQLKKENGQLLLACTLCIVIESLIVFLSIFVSFDSYRLHALVVMTLVALMFCLLEIKIRKNQNKIKKSH